ncbi:peptide deformylase [Paramaledivibacter caminithermalis]|uniref:Peptide deformylase n=1 Tax=Paramaledivibacter caminithermalis (strain DSM 15212 / CIP 107654 / DViRD3) TaxID=1121301 RepID=A0A1M6NHB7_PARC5|nr:peptide deformylase [Paramaledivibacter caminithermalis]SHJ95077.1 peptide deformylase [Paramaledivibacter caminithermalis DSM 15212]
MAIRNIRIDDDPILRKKSRTVEKIDDRILQLIDDMIDTMYEANGVGLAAPQIGILKRIIVIDVGDGIIELINPEFVSQSGSQIDEEGCLSIPNKTGNVERPRFVKVRGLNREGKEIYVEGEELLARALCHEIDHLNGILFIDKIIEE